VNSLTDQQLLCDYTGRRSEAAFAELVRRHVDFVYSAAQRMVHDAHLAEDVTQGTFVALARNAAQLTDRPVLSGWLHRTAQNLAANTVRSDVRRRAREQEAAAMNELLAAEPDATWEHIAPQLDAALGELSEADRDALLLRYFERKSAREMAQTLGTSEDAAQKRVSRAVDRLREFFAKRGVAIGASGLVVVISANAVQAAPAGLAITISATALAGTAISTSTVIAATKALAMTTLQKTLITATIATAVGTGIYEARQASTLRNQVQSLQQQQAPLAGQIRQLQQERADATKRLASLADELAKAKSNNLELMKLRGQMTQLRNETEIENDPAFQKARLWMAKELKLRQQFEEHPDQWIPEMKHLSSEEWLDQARKADLDTATGMRCALSNVRVAAAFNFANKISEALHAYMNAHNQQLPDSTSQLSAYFQPPVDGADAILSRYEMSNSEQQANPAYRGASIIQKTLVDHIDNAILIGEQTVSSVPPPHWPAVIPDELEPVVKSYEDANHRGFLTIYDLEPYATTPAEKEALNKVIKAATTYTAVAAP
jgi:RNA polymerase sigma factor (sigma-70 family)